MDLINAKALLGQSIPGCVITDPCDPAGEILTVTKGKWIATIDLSRNTVMEDISELADTYELEIAHQQSVEAGIKKQKRGDIRLSAKNTHGSPW